MKEIGGGQASRLKSSPLKTSGLVLIRLYQQTIGEIIPDRCRFTPTCSQYALEAIKRHGFVNGVHLAYRRIKRCRCPNSGYDPVPTSPVIAVSTESPVERSNTNRIKREDAKLIELPVQGKFGGNSDRGSYLNGCDGCGCGCGDGCDAGGGDVGGCDGCGCGDGCGLSMKLGKLSTLWCRITA